MYHLCSIWYHVRSHETKVQKWDSGIELIIYLCRVYLWEMEHWHPIACGHIIIIQLVPVLA